MLYSLICCCKFVHQVKDILTKLDSTKSTGVDGISATVLKECAWELSYPLTLLFNLSFQIGKVPVSWKRANVTPVFKSNAKEKVENYCPISLLSIPAKCQERIVHNAIYSQVAPYLTKWQHGFVGGRSCATQLVLSHHHWSKALDEGRHVDVIFLDFTKAFARVAHDVLLQKLCNFGISGANLPQQQRAESCDQRGEFFLVLYPFRCTSGLITWPLVFCNFYQWPARSCYPREHWVIICWWLQNIKGDKLPRRSFSVSVWYW